MNELQIYNNPQFGEIRAVSINDEPWFVGKDVAAVLGYSKPLNAIATHVDADDSLKQGLTDSVGRTQQTIIINESGLYSLILSSKLPAAKEFKRWVTSDVLPSLRRHGVYATNELLNNPDFLIDALTALKAERAKNAELQPKADYYDAVANSEGLTSFRETAKLFGVQEKQFYEFVERNKLCYRDAHKRLMPYAKYHKKGYFEVREMTFSGTMGNHTKIYTKITPQGRQYIHSLLKKEGEYGPAQISKEVPNESET